MHGQVPVANVYHADNGNGVVHIYAENHGFVPYTISLRAELVNVHCTDVLPVKIVVYPSKLPWLLTTLTYEPSQTYSYRYFYPNQYGIYSSSLPDTSQIYQLPFKQASSAVNILNPKDKSQISGKHYFYYFDLPAGTPICAARDGIIAASKQDAKGNKRHDLNYVIVFHDDGTYANYLNLMQEGTMAKLGQRVVAGDIIGHSSVQKHHLHLNFQVRYCGNYVPEELPVKFQLPDTVNESPH